MLNLKNNEDPIKVHYQSPDAVTILSNSIKHRLLQRPGGKTVSILCIGTDRSTGDSLGPLVGTSLIKEYHLNSVFGTLDNPVHAVNLADTMINIRKTTENPYIIAIDACLGHLSAIGQITLAEGPLRPGAGVNKTLPEVGDIHLTGIVNVGGFMEYFVLQNTRLSIVYQMAEIIAHGVACGFQEGLSQNPLESLQNSSPRTISKSWGLLFKG